MTWFTVDMVYTVDRVYTVDMVYTVDTLYTVGPAELHGTSIIKSLCRRWMDGTDGSYPLDCRHTTVMNIAVVGKVLGALTLTLFTLLTLLKRLTLLALGKYST